MSCCGTSNVGFLDSCFIMCNPGNIFPKSSTINQPLCPKVWICEYKMEFCQANYDCNMGVSNVKFADNLLFESTSCSLQIIPAKFTRDVHVNTPCTRADIFWIVNKNSIKTSFRKQALLKINISHILSLSFPFHLIQIYFHFKI